MRFLARANHIQENVFEGRILALLCAVAQFLQRALGYQRALVDNANARGEALHHFHNMRGEDGSAMARRVVQDIANDTRADGINTLKWLIEKEYLGAMDERGGQRALFAHADRVIDYQLIGIVIERQHLQQFFRTQANIGFRHPVHMPGEGEKFAPGQALVQVQIFWQDTHQRTRLDGITPYVDATYICGTTYRPQKTGQHFDGGGFTGAIWTQKAEKLTTLYRQIEMVDRDLLPKHPHTVTRYYGSRYLLLKRILLLQHRLCHHGLILFRKHCFPFLILYFHGYN